MPNEDGTPGQDGIPETPPTSETPVASEASASAPISQDEQDMADGHRYQSQEFRDAREAAKPASDRKRPARDGKSDAKSDAKGPKKGGKDGKDAKAPAKTERIAKVLARAGLASRREVERLIGLGKIAVNGRILETPAVLVSSVDIITVEGQPIGKAEPTRLWRYHKPVGLMTTHSDPQGRPTVFEKLPQPMPRSQLRRPAAAHQ
jgi:23S rRNA pseudouridine2605 synthase